MAKKSVQWGVLYDKNGRRLDNVSLNINFHFEKHSSLTMVNKNNRYVDTFFPLSHLGFDWLHYINVYIINIYWFGKIYTWRWMLAPFKWSLGIYPVMAAYYWFKIFLFCYRNGLLCPGGVAHTIYTLKHYYITLLHWKYQTCQHSYQYGLTTHSPQVWLPITMGETQTIFSGVEFRFTNIPFISVS